MITNTLIRRNDLLPSLMDDFFKPWNNWLDRDEQTRTTLPAVNIIENNADYQITVAAPGMRKDDFHIDVNNRTLTINAEAEKTTEDKDVNFTRREYNYTSFSRSFSLPQEVDENKIEASYENGILHISLPKKEGSKTAAAKTITVK